MESDFVHLHLHDEFSYLDSTIKIEDLQQEIEKRGIVAIAQTNHGNIDGCLRFWNAVKEKGVKPIIGCELYVVKNPSVKYEDEKRYHVTVLVKNKKGFANLCRLLTKASLEGFHKKPRVSLDDLLEAEGLIILSGCSSSPFYVYPEYVKKFKDRFGSDFYLEVMPFAKDFIGERPDDWYFFDHMKHILKLHREYGCSLVMTNDVHYLKKEDKILHDVVKAIAQNKKWKDKTRKTFDVEGLYLRNRKEMEEEAKRQGLMSEEEIKRALDATLEIAEKIEFEIEKYEPVLPLPGEYKGVNEHDALRDLCKKGLERIGKANDEKYVERANKELDRIIPRFTRYFLIVYEFVNWAKAQGIFLGPGRGSVNGCLVAYLLGITSVDPIKYNLLFERFISEGRTDLPDIDLDFEDKRRKEVIQHLKDKYGEYNVALVSTFSDLKGKMIIRDLGRIFEIPISEIDAMAQAIIPREKGDSRANLTVYDTLNSTDIGKRFKEKYSDVADYAWRLEGLIRQKGVHAAGVVLSAEDLRLSGKGVLEITNEGIALNWDKRDLEFFGFVKYDILGLKTLTILKEAAEFVKKNKGVKVNYEELPLDDQEVYKMISAGDTFGVFQFQSLSLQKFSKKIGVEDFKALCDLSALHRPSGIRGGIITQYENRKKGKEKITYLYPSLEPILKETYGLPFYQEQVMFILNCLAGLPWEMVDEVRKVIAKSQGAEQMRKFKKHFVEGCLKKGTLTKKEAEKVFEMLVHFGGYGFNKSHCVGYSIITYWTAYMKKYFPLEYFCAYLRHSDEEELCLRELSRKGIPYRLPSINESDVSWTISSSGELLCGLSSIKGIGEKIAQKIVEEREKNGKFKSLGDFVRRTKINISALQALSKSSALDEILDKKSKLSIIVEGEIPKATQFNLLMDEDGEKIGILEVDENKWKREVIPFVEYNDVFGIYANLVEFLKSGMEFVPLKNLEFGKKNLAERYAVGRLENVRYGYKNGTEQIVNTNSFEEIYGNLVDNTDFAKVVFKKTFYIKQQEIFENLEGRQIIVKFNQRTGMSISAKDVWLLEDVARGNLKGLPFSFFQKLEKFDCPKSCENRCPGYGNFVPLEIGEYRILLVGEAPGVEEDKQGKPFVGKSGELLFKSLRERGLERGMFCISNVMKCRPPEGKIKNFRDAKKCVEMFLKKEIEMIKPTAILCLGGTPTKIFAGDKKITEMMGKVIWNDSFGCFVVFSLHPASVLYHRENMEMFEVGIENFVRLLAKEELIQVEEISLVADEETEETEKTEEVENE